MDYYFGKRGCDNRTSFIFNDFGYKVYNFCYDIKSYHNHRSNFRSRRNKKTNKILDRLKGWYMYCSPIKKEDKQNYKKYHKLVFA